MSQEKKELSQPKTHPAMLSEAMSVEDVVGHVKLIREAVSKVMEEGETKDYGVIPGTNKPTLFKAGAEKLCVLFRLAPSFETTEYWDGQHLTIKSRCVLTHITSGRVVGSGDGICSTKEKKYAKRKHNGKYVDNNELPDLYNTIIKMADKRALVAAVLIVTAASSEFTQDRGDDEKPSDKDEKAPEAPSTATPMKEIGGTAAVKEPLAVPDGNKTWIGKITSVEPSITPRGTKFLLIRGGDVSFIIRKPEDKDKAGMNIYEMKWRDLEANKDKGEDVCVEYAISPTGSWLLMSSKVAEAMPF